jgi:hypothetical protein
VLPARFCRGIAAGWALRPKIAGLFLIVSRRNRSQMRAALPSLLALGHPKARRRLTIATGNPSGSPAAHGFLTDATCRAPHARGLQPLPTCCPDTQASPFISNRQTAALTAQLRFAADEDLAPLGLRS